MESIVFIVLKYVTKKITSEKIDKNQDTFRNNDNSKNKIAPLEKNIINPNFKYENAFLTPNDKVVLIFNKFLKITKEYLDIDKVFDRRFNKKKAPKNHKMDIQQPKNKEIHKKNI